ncbi:MAG TPA: TPM domain-containing protein [Chitinophagales bacterium]|nr:TPM domain-containing protein [Chitinophagales bacterium]
MATSFLSAHDKKEIAAAIQEAEKNTIGEIRVFVEKKCDENPLERSLKIFHKLKMHQTKAHTGVLIYVAHDDHKLAILGDEGIHSKVPENFWDDVKNMMVQFFTDGKFAEGLKQAVVKCGEHLQKHFPSTGSNPNELSNEVITGDQ